MSTRNRSVILFVFFAMLASCGGPALRQKAIDTGFTGLNALRDGFVTWDKEHQEQIVDKATSLDDGKAKLASYRVARAKVSEAFMTAYAALNLAAINPNDDNFYEAARRAIKDLVAAFDELRGAK